MRLKAKKQGLIGKTRLISRRPDKYPLDRVRLLQHRKKVLFLSAVFPFLSRRSRDLGFLFSSISEMDAIDSVIDPLRDFAKDSLRLVKRCHKPDRKEFTKVAIRTAIGFVVMGFVGFFVKLIFIPINNIIVGSG
ncbi:protein transport protein Sec61 subunit gamma-1-like [Magnolia sinica]|uniref:protein transport protein Sec61 subunit gamma-1-like n=1 Tax=Magnolia sinica TaxID=86752 RepID=UPI002659D088|nr:protein transport protein Sec61 subunit gamma-1-like [Magnolia sinica]